MSLKAEMTLRNFREITPKGWTAPDGLDYEGWKERGQIFAMLEGGIQWCVGDWLNYGERKYGEKYAEAIEATGLSYQTVADYKWVASRFEFSLRKENLSFRHHVAVASLPSAERSALLDKAAGEGWTVRQLTSAKNAAKRSKRLSAIGEASANEDFPEGMVFPVIYADPPWRYDHEQFGGETRAIENQYPTMTVEDICALPVKTIAHEDAVLFLWATAPKLIEALAVMEAWGFDYRTHMVWDKVSIGMGYWFRGRHEFLMVGTRGKIPSPNPGTQPESIYAERRNAHSEKPEFFAEMIGAFFPGVPKVELFARVRRDGWHVWGNQILAVA